MTTKIAGVIKSMATAELQEAVAQELKSDLKEIPIKKLIDDIITDEEIEDIVEDTTEVVNESAGRSN